MDSPRRLYMLPFDHRDSFEHRLFGFKGALDLDETAQIIGAKRLIYEGFLLALERFGYDVTDGFAATVAFQRRFRPELIDGTIDGECRAILLALLLPQPEGN